jgi:hypothetical protein
MKGFDFLLKVMSNQGYPNPKLQTMMRAIGYNGENFLIDLVEKFGIRKAEEFVRKTLGKLSEPNTQDYLIKVPLKNLDDSWIELIIYDFYIDDEESETDIIINYGWGDSRIVDPYDGTVKTLDDISDEADMGDWADYQDFLDDIRGTVYDFIAKRCGFGIWYQ